LVSCHLILTIPQINGSAVLVQERIARVGLNVAWTYLSPEQKMSFKEQTRSLLRQLHHVQAAGNRNHRSYVVPDPDPIQNHGIQAIENEILFSLNNDDPDLSLMHNDCQSSNLIVHNDKIVGLVDWEMAGFFGWKTARQVHLEIRMPKKEDFAAARLDDDRLADVLFWNDLYSDGVA